MRVPFDTVGAVLVVAATLTVAIVLFSVGLRLPLAGLPRADAIRRRKRNGSQELK